MSNTPVLLSSTDSCAMPDQGVVSDRSGGPQGLIDCSREGTAEVSAAGLGPSTGTVHTGPSLRCVSANVQKSALNHGLLLENNRDSDIIFVQEPYRGFIKIVSSTSSPDGEDYCHTTAHRSFICLGYSEKTRVLIYVNVRWRSASPQLRTALVRHDDVACVTLRVAGEEMLFVNVYNDSRTFSAVTHLLGCAELLPKVTVMAGDFNLRDPMWDAGERGPGAASRHLSQREQLIELATEQLGLALANDPDGPPTWLPNNLNVRDGVIDLVWVNPDVGTVSGIQVDDLGRVRSDHAVLRWEVPLQVAAKAVPNVKRGSEEGEAYVRQCRAVLNALPLEFSSREHVEGVGQWVSGRWKSAWDQHASLPVASTHSRSWWSRECTTRMKELRNLRLQRKELVAERRRWQSRVVQAGIGFDLAWVREVTRLTQEVAAITAHIDRAGRRLKGAVRRAKRVFFDETIARTQPSRVWDLVDWTRPRKATASTGLTDSEGRPIEEPDRLAEAFQEQFTPTNPRLVDMAILEEMPQLEERSFPPITEREVQEALSDTSNFSAPGPDNASWFWLKHIVSDLSGCECGDDAHVAKHSNTVVRVAAYFNACIQFGIHPSIFKQSRTVVIPKLGKPDYSKAKAYRPIVLLNCLGKLLEKVIARRMQFDAQKAGVMHPCQFGGAFQHSTQDAGIQLVHCIQQAWKRGLDSSALLLDVAQFFPSVHHQMMAAILRKQGFHSTLCMYFEDYLVGRQTEFVFNGHQSGPTDFSTGVGQGSALSPVLTGLYLAPVLHLVAPVGEVLEGNATLQFFVDDGLLHVAADPGPTYDRSDGLLYNNLVLRRLVELVVKHLGRLGLGVEVDKLELMHFRRARAAKWSEREPLGPALEARIDGVVRVVVPKAVMRYLGFFLDPKLTFREHVRFYATKASSTVQALRLLGNSARGLSPRDKRRLYISNVLPVLAYGAQLWWHPSWKGRKWVADALQKAQNRAARWITGGFRTTPPGALEMMAGLFPVKHQIDKLMKKACLRTRVLHMGHPTRAHLPAPWRASQSNIKAPMPLGNCPGRDDNSPMVHVNILGCASTEEFDVLHAECRPGERLVDMLADRVVHHLNVVEGERAPPKAEKDRLTAWINTRLNPLIWGIESDRACALVFTDGSQKKLDGPGPRVAAGAAWLVKHNGRVRQGRFGCGRATAYDAEVAALARGLGEAAMWLPESVMELHVFADNQAALTSVLAAGRGPAQMLSVAACATVRRWLAKDPRRCVHLWWCPGHRGVLLNGVVDKEAGLATAEPCSDVSFAYARQCITEQACQAWQADMARPEYRGRNSLLRTDGGFAKCKHTAANWFLRRAGQDTGQFARLVRFVSGHFPHGEFRERFNLEGNRRCLCGKAVVETRDHIWFDCELWIRKHRPPNGGELQGGGRRDALDLRPRTPPGMSAREHALRLWRDAPPDVEEVAEFLLLNPMVATFRWLELGDQASEGAASGGLDSTASLRVKLHTLMRKEAYTRWVRSRPDGTTAEFNLAFARAALESLKSRGPLDEDGQLQVLEECGVAKALAWKCLRDWGRERGLLQLVAPRPPT
jgi:ribonuclease HI